MNYRRIGTTDIKVSEISFGCWTMGGLNWVNGQPNGWAEVDEEEVTDGIKTAVDFGVNHFDNADVYGNGRAERMLSRVLQQLDIKSEELIIATKIGHFPGTAQHAYEPAHIRHQCEQSLINLKRDYIDIYYFHQGNFGENDKYVPEAVETMQNLMKEGKVRVCGLSAYSSDDFSRLIPKIKPSVLQGRANAIDSEFLRPGSVVQELMDKHKLSFVAFSPLAQGRLLDKYDPDDPPVFESGDNRREHKDFRREALAELKPKLEKLKERFGLTTEELAAVALNYILAHSNVACVIPGFRNEKQAKCNVSAAGSSLSQEDVEFIRQVFS